MTQKSKELEAIEKLQTLAGLDYKEREISGIKLKFNQPGGYNQLKWYKLYRTRYNTDEISNEVLFEDIEIFALLVYYCIKSYHEDITPKHVIKLIESIKTPQEIIDFINFTTAVFLNVDMETPAPEKKKKTKKKK